ncbi:hypothetical protein ACVWWR_007708 [Bradyrhizobium sp. LM3.2]
MPWTDATHGLGQVYDRLHHRATGGHHLGEEGTAAIGVVAARGQLFHVVAGGEGGTIGRDHDAADSLVVADLIELGMQACDHRLREAVAGGPAVEGQDRDGTYGLAQQDRRLRGGGAGGLDGHRSVSGWIIAIG